jgi:uncharacterized protein
MGLYEDLLAVAADADVLDACLGLHWTGVWVWSAGGERCGLASTLRPRRLPGQDETPAVAEAGELASQPARSLAERVPRGGPEASLGFAALQAMIPLHPERWAEGNAERVLARRCQGKRLALVGRFGFASALRALAASVAVLELDPLPGERPAEQAGAILPQSDLIVITGMALVNRTLESLLALCPPGSEVALVGPSVPLSEVLFGYGVRLLCGAFVEAPAPVMAGIRQGANFHQIHHLGTRLVTMER